MNQDPQRTCQNHCSAPLKLSFGDIVIALAVMICLSSLVVVGGGVGVGERVNYDELYNERYFLTYLILAFKPVDLPVNSVQAGRQQIARYPLVSVLSSLCVHFGDTHWSREIKLDPLVVIVVSCAPGSHVSSMPYSTQSSQPSRVMPVVLR